MRKSRIPEARQRGAKPQQHTTQSLLAEAKTLDFTNRSVVRDFMEKFHEPILRELAGSVHWSADEIWKFLQSTLPIYPELLVPGEDSTFNPLDIILTAQNHSFVQVVLDTAKEPEMDGILRARTSEGYNCLHLAIKCRSPYTTMMIEACKNFRDMFVEKGHKACDTPLHLAVSHLDNPDDTSDTCRHDETARSAEDMHQKLINGLLRRKCPTASYSDEILRLLLLYCDEALFLLDCFGSTPYQRRIKALRTAEHQSESERDAQDWVIEGKVQEAVASDRIAFYIRCYCLRSFNDVNTKRALHDQSPVQRITLDLTEIKGNPMSENYSNEALQLAEFESTLRLVRLPNLAVEHRLNSSVDKMLKLPPAVKSRNDMIAVFNLLRKKRVRKIIEVDFADNEYLPHTDEAIENALKGFEVEKLNWEKPDISSEVVYNSTSALTEVSLYWSGDEAVVKEWCSPEGFGNARKFPKLEVVHFFVSEGNNNTEAHQNWIEKLQNQLASSVDASGQHARVEYGGTWPRLASGQRLENDMIRPITDFAAFINTIPDNAANLVKIAVISSDGFENLAALKRKIAVGWEDYFISSGNRGTVAATLIAQTCPKAQLYVVRAKTRDQIALAIDWAVQCKVNIISIDFPFDERSIMEEEIAMKNASRYGIVMLCSAAGETNHRFPGYVRRVCITIGAATHRGEQSALTDDERFDCLLPGENILLQDSNGRVQSSESGNHVAMAIASGVTGLLIFCCNLAAPEHINPISPDAMRYLFRDLSREYGKFKISHLFRGHFKNLSWQVSQDKSREYISDLVEEIQAWESYAKLSRD